MNALNSKRRRFLFGFAFFLLAALLLGIMTIVKTTSGNSSLGKKDKSEQSLLLLKYARNTGAPWIDSKEEKVVFLPQKKKVIDVSHSSDSSRRDNWKGVGNFIYWFCIYFFCACILGVVCYELILFWRKRVLKKDALAVERAKRRRRIEALTDEVKEHWEHLLESALEALVRNDLRSATIFYFSWLLVELDKNEFIFLEKGKTDLDYWRELEGRDSLREIYSSIMIEFERVYFGELEISRKVFDSIWAFRESLEKIFSPQQIEEPSASSTKDILTRVVFIWILCSLCAGCGNSQREWREEYANETLMSSPQSLNSIAAFTAYCQKEKDLQVVRYNPYRRQDETEFSACVWFQSYAAYGWWKLGYWDLVKPVLQDDANFDDTVDAWYDMLEHYANASDEDWEKLFIIGCDRDFWERQDEIKEWLEERPNRVFIYAPADWNAKLEYWRAARQRLLDAKNANPAYLKECDSRIEFANLQKSERSSLYGEFIRRREKAREILKKSENNRRNFYISYHSTEEDNVYSEDDEIREDLENVPLSTDLENASLFTRSDYDENGYDFSYKFRQKDLWGSQCLAPLDLDDSITHKKEFVGKADWLSDLSFFLPSTENYQLEPLGETTVSATLDGLPFICERRVGESRVIMLNSASFLTNYGMLDAGRRTLADRIASLFEPKSKVCFIVSEFRGFKKEHNPPTEISQSKYTLTRVTPFSILIWHFVAFVTVVFLWRWPIFGRPRKNPPEKLNDFGLHIEAYGGRARTNRRERLGARAD